MTDFILHDRLAADTTLIGDLTACRVLLMNESKFPWLILVPRQQNISELHQLDKQTLTQVQHESIVISELLMSLFNGDKLNTGALGNLVPQLHLHHIVRFKTDSVWPAPVWGNFTPEQYTADALNALKVTLQRAITDTGEPFSLARKRIT